ncbi:MAG: glycosyltransferase family 4 protein [Methanoregula sp.]
MKITFILPGFIKIPVGGVKVVNEYANRLSDRSHEVTLVYPIQIKTGNPIYFFRKKISSLFDRLQHVSDDLYYIPKPSVNIMVVQRIISKYIPSGDVVIAVGWQTAEAVALLPPEHGRKFYLLQSFETYFSRKKRILATYHLPLKKIAVSGWIMAEMEKIGENSFGPLGNAIHPEEFYIESPQPERRNDVMMVYHPHKIKGAKDGIEVLKMTKKHLPELTATIVAPRKPIHRIPSWIQVIVRPSIEELRHLYNTSKVFLHTSHWEGWGLPPMEAMACGCAVVAIDNQGVREYLTNNYNALIVQIDNIRQLMANVDSLLADAGLRSKLIENGFRTVDFYKASEITTKLENFIT